MRTFFEQCVATAAACFISLVVVFPTIISADVYINNFAVHIEGGHDVASRVARDLGMRNLGQIGSLDDHYVFESPHRERRSAEPSHEHHQLLEGHGEVRWFEQQVAKSRKKRDFRPQEVAELIGLIDPHWSDQWYLHGGALMGFDMNVMGAWKKGYTGKNIVVSILDDGIEYDHPDLKRNYDPNASYDFNSLDADPMPRSTINNGNRHGTRCAGEVSAEANNTYCTVGIAPDARIGGIRMLDGDVTDVVEASSLNFNLSHIDIYSSSWGPDDDGKTVDGPGKLATKAFIEGIEKGRGGKGSIFVWASGNGGRATDSCSCDGYVNSIFTVSISSTTQNGTLPWYGEECSSIMATTYSSGSDSLKKIATTDLQKKCTLEHTGTSASAPLAAGIVAMLLQANNYLTWRDVQYIIVMTSRPDTLSTKLWITNGVGRNVNHQSGYGLMDASAMVNLGLLWNNVPPKHECLVVSSVGQQSFSSTEGFHGTLDSIGCKGLGTEVNFLEHVQCRLSLTAPRRGDLVIYLTSPQGTRSKILHPRIRDKLQGGFDDWPFMSVHFWGENPTGTWKLEVQNYGFFDWNNEDGVLLSWSLVLHGTKEQPVHLKNETYVKTTQQTPTASSSTTRTSTVHLSTAAPELQTSSKSLPSTTSTTESLVETSPETPKSSAPSLQTSTKSLPVAPIEPSTTSTTESLGETSPDTQQSSALSLKTSTKSLPVAPTEPSTTSTTESLVETSPETQQSSAPSLQTSTKSLPVAPTELSTTSTTESLVETSPETPQSSAPSVTPPCPSRNEDFIFNVDQLLNFIAASEWTPLDLQEVQNFHRMGREPRPGEEPYKKYLELYKKVVPAAMFENLPMPARK